MVRWLDETRIVVVVKEFFASDLFIPVVMAVVVKWLEMCMTDG
jgi:hypothetical protein